MLEIGLIIFILVSLTLSMVYYGKSIKDLERVQNELWHTVDTIGRKCQKLLDDDCRKIEKLKDEIRLLRHEIYDIRENIKKQGPK